MESRELIDFLSNQKVLDARRMPAEQKLLAGVRLFQAVESRMVAGIKDQFPQFTEDEIRTELQRRLKIHRQLENRRDSR